MVFRPPKKSKDVTPSDTSTASDMTDLSVQLLWSTQATEITPSKSRGHSSVGCNILES